MGGTYSSLYVEGGSEGAREGGPGCRAHTRAVATLDTGTGRLRHRHPGRAPRCQRRGAPVAPWDERARRDLHPATGLDPRAGVFPRLGAQTGAGFAHSRRGTSRETQEPGDCASCRAWSGAGLTESRARPLHSATSASQTLQPGARRVGTCTPRRAWTREPVFSHAMCAHTQKRVRTLTPWNLERGAGARRLCVLPGLVWRPGSRAHGHTPQGSRARPVHSATSAPQTAVKTTARGMDSRGPATGFDPRAGAGRGPELVARRAARRRGWGRPLARHLHARPHAPHDRPTRPARATAPSLLTSFLEFPALQQNLFCASSNLYWAAAG